MGSVVVSGSPGFAGGTLGERGVLISSQAVQDPRPALVDLAGSGFRVGVSV
jgi:hypothetical protein